MSRDWLNLTWNEKTWGERAQTAIANVLAGAVGLAALVGVLWLVGTAIDVADQRRNEHRSCLKHATNGLEIERCR